MIWSLVLSVAATYSNLALLPPMGWNSYDCFGYSVTEAQVKDSANYLADHLKQYGWRYVVIDYVWSSPKLKGLDPPTQTADFQPRLAMDKYGRLIPDPARFPSSAGGKGFKPLADWLHAKGLKFGIHLMRGIPRQAVGDKCPILDSPLNAVDAANQKSPCPWLNHMWGLNMQSPAGQQYLDSIFKLYATWGVDFVKVDDLSNPYSAAEVEGYAKAIEHCGRPIALSLSPGPTPLPDAAHVVAHANMWRLLGDLWDNWDQLDAAFEAIAAWNPYRTKGHWPDPDMLPLGQLRVYGPPTGPPNTPSRFSYDEAKTLMTLWCIARCPLMIGGNLPETDPVTESLLTCRPALWVNQRSFNNRVIRGGEHPAWAAGTPEPNIQFVALFNREDSPSTVDFRLSDIGIEDCLSHDVWDMKTGMRQREHLILTRTIPAHGAVLLELSVRKRARQTEPGMLKPNLSGTSYEAESTSNTRTGETVVADDPAHKCSGGRLVKFIGLKPENRLRFNRIVAPRSGDYVVTVFYMSAERRQMYLAVNGGPPQFHTFYPTGGWDGNFLGWSEVRVTLHEGDNSVEIGNPKAWGVDVDRIIVR